MLFDRKEISLLPLVTLITITVQILVLIVTVLTFGRITKIADSKVPNLVELNDGTTARVISTKHRSNQVIKSFIVRVLTALMSWNAATETVENQTGNSFLKAALDEGVEVKDGRVTTAVWQAGFSLSEDFRVSFLSEIGKLTPQGVFSGKSESLLLINHLSQPTSTGGDKWKVDMVASLIIVDSSKNSTAIPFNKTVFVRSIEVPTIDLKSGSSGLKGSNTQLQEVIYKARKDGLEIYQIQDLQR